MLSFHRNCVVSSRVLSDMDGHRRLATCRPLHSAGGVPLFAALFALLLFLIVLTTTPLTSHGKPLLLPVAQSSTPFIDAGDLVYVSATYDGSVFVDAKWYPSPELPGAIEAAVMRSPTCTGCGLVLRIDRSLPFSQLRRLLRHVAAAGASRVILAVEPTPSTPLLPASNPACSGLAPLRAARR